MAETEHVEFELDVNDNASPKLSRLEKNIGKVGGAVDRASSNFTGMIKQSAMFAGFFALGPAIAGAQHYIDHLDRISDLTGIAADRVGGISNALQGAGVSAEGVDSVFNRLVKKGAQVAEGNKMLIKLGHKYGVTIKEGPEEALLGVSKLLEKGKINAGGLQRILGVSSDDAADLVDALKQGPDALKDKFEELTKQNSAFNEEAMKGMQEYKNASSRIGEAWHRMTAGILIKLAPALTKMADRFEHSIDGWADGAQKFGDYLVKHMDQLIAGAKIYAKIMFANAVSQKLTGVGALGNAQKIWKVGGGGAGVLGKLLPGLAGSLSRVKGKSYGPLSGGESKVAGMFSSISAATGPLGKIFSGILGIAGKASLFAIIVGAIIAIGKNLDGVRTRFQAIFTRMGETIGKIGAEFAKIFDSGTMQSVISVLLTVVEKFLEAVETLLRGIKEILEAPGRITEGLDFGIGERMLRAQQVARGGVTRDLIEGYGGMIKNRLTGALSGIAGLRPKTDYTEKKDKEVNMNFPNARFDIKQSFAEGYDPDRIAVAFQNELGSLGERRLQSGLSPLFTAG